MTIIRKCLNCRHCFVETNGRKKLSCFHTEAETLGSDIADSVSPEGHCGHGQKHFELHPFYPQGREFLMGRGA